MGSVDEAAARATLARRIVAGVGGCLALEFANTAGDHLGPAPHERLTSWERFAAWAVQVGLVPEGDYLATVAQPGSLERIVALRDQIFRVGVAVARGEAPVPADVDGIAAEARRPGPEPRPRPGGLEWRFEPDATAEQLATVIARDALGLLCSGRTRRLGVCENGACGWLFIDESRGRRRRWCSMGDCGNLAKSRRHRAKQA